MFLSAELINLILYCAQQFGVALGFGSATVLLVAYLIAMRDGKVDDKEAQYYRAVRGALNIGLLFIILSGVGITALHAAAAQDGVLTTPAFLFKWILVGMALGFTLLARSRDHWALEGLSGGTWYALFLVHILAPVTGWFNLITLYAVWMVGFNLCWAALVYAMKGKTETPSIATLLPKIKKLPHELKTLFDDWLQIHYPLRAAHVMNIIRDLRCGKAYVSRFGERMTGSGEYAQLVRQRFRLACKKAGLNNFHEELDCSLFKVPARPGDQLTMF